MRRSKLFHSGAQRLIEVWRALPDAGRIPARAALDPAVFGAALPQVFLLTEAGGETRFALAGEQAESLFGPTGRGRAWSHPWRPSSRGLATSVLAQARREARPVVLLAERGAARQALEITIAPLRGPGGATDRWIGLAQDIDPRRPAIEPGPALLGARMAVAVGPPGRPPLSLAAVGGRRTA